MDEYNRPVALSNNEDELKQEIERLRNTASFQFGNHIVKAFENPIRILVLPITILFLTIRLLKNRRNYPQIRNNESRDCILLFSSYSKRGIHFDRCEALISDLTKNGSQLIHVTNDKVRISSKRKNTLYFKFPSRKDTKGMDPGIWNLQCQNFMNNLLDVYTPKTFIFDGDYPFRGMLNSIQNREDMNRFWIRESALNYKTTSLPVSGFEIFDSVIHPTYGKEFESDMHVGTSGTILCDPIVHREPEKRTIENFRDKYCKKGEVLIFFDLVTRDDIVKSVVNKLLKHENVKLVIRDCLDTEDIIHHPRTISVDNLSYSVGLFSSDAAVIYGDFFSLHTAVQSKTPSICLLREDERLEIFYKEFSTKNLPWITITSETDDEILNESINRILDHKVREQLKSRLKEFDFQYNHQPLVDIIIDHHNSSQD